MSIFARSCLFLLAFTTLKGMGQSISLAGSWQYRLDPQQAGIKEEWYRQLFAGTVQLPGTLDDNKIGAAPTLTDDTLSKTVLLNLTRKHSYIGVAWYRKEVNIPENWRQKHIELFLERVIWQTRVWIDGQEIGVRESLSVPQVFNTAGLLKPGRHLIVLRIDNSKQYDISLGDRNFAHAYTEGTQIIWNGVIGKIQLQATGQNRIDDVQMYPDPENRSVQVNASLLASNNTKGSVQFTILYKNKIVATRQMKVTAHNNSVAAINATIPVPNAQLWDEFHPNLYQLRVTLRNNNRITHEKTFQFGMRRLTNANSQLQINGRRIFLRGTLECNIFPLTGHPPMDKKGWLKVFTTAKQYGLNHLRFHSWCPPRAAFEVADSLGFYLQVENPLWILNIGADTTVSRFIAEEADRISREYGNHPSFCFWSMGNELQGDLDQLHKLMSSLREKDNRHLYTTTTFTFQNGHGKWPEPGDDFYITQYTKKGWVRGQGIFNDYTPEFNKDYTASIEGLPVPIVTHEIGQYSVYPDMAEIKKYTGVLDPLNFKAIQKDLQRKGLPGVSPAWSKASGALAANLYKEEIERALKTKGSSGFQLLDLHDFPGQGTALVGLLDAFWDSKGLITPAAFREFCAPVVPLIRFNKAIYTNDEKFIATTEIVNFSDRPIGNAVVEWSIKGKNGIQLAGGKFHPGTIAIGNGETIGKIEYGLSKIKSAMQLIIQVRITGTDYRNSWPIWVYPVAIPASDPGIVVTRSVTEAQELLNAGKTVLLNPDTAVVNGVEGRFAPVFWSPVHFPNQPGTMGLLMNANHPAFAHFPTDSFTNWQWWDLTKRSKTMIIDDSYKNCTPIVTMIDNFFKNRRMSNMVEARYGKGKLLIVTMDISSDLDKRPSARQLRYSLMEYMKSGKFNPAATLREADLKGFFR